MSDLQFWKNGQPLSNAAIKFGDLYQVGKWRSADNSVSIDAHGFLLFSDLFGLIQSGEFVAFGFRIEPNVSDGPIRIPEHTFEPRPELELVRCDKLQVSGHSYERVRILPRMDVEKDKSAIATPANTAGRRSTYSMSRTVIETLFQVESNRGKSAAKLHSAFRTEFERQFPLSEWEIAPPSERTLGDHLKRYRQELEGTHSA